MQPGARRRARINGGVVAGSIWETRMKMDEVKGGIKVFNAENETAADEDGIRVCNRRLGIDQGENTIITGSTERRKRRNWKPPDPITDSPMVCVGDRDEEENDAEIEIGGEVGLFDDKEIDLPKEVSISPNIEMEHEIVPAIDLDPVKPQTIEAEEEMVEIESEAPNRMQDIVDLVMWRDIAKTAFVFGFGTFILLSSSYTRDLDFSLISAICYLGLVYLALIFIYKSILSRGAIEFDEGEEKCIIGEDEAIRALRFLLPYINEVLTNIKALFSGDPATTMKLAVLLFVMARCGSSLTVWTLAKLAFFGLFTIPKILSSYSVQLARYGKFWVERFRDGWESCTHKKAVAAAIFALVWNISSTVARIWAVFMLVVAVKFYQQCAWECNNAVEEQELKEESKAEEDQERQEHSSSGLGPAAVSKYKAADNGNGIQLKQRQRNGPITRSKAAAAARTVGKGGETTTATKIKRRA